jgi:N-acetylmuramoyl-L-alanine amidase
MVALDDLVSQFRVAVREDTLANAVIVSYDTKTIVLTPDQTLASVGGRLISLPAPLTRSGRRWLVPIELIGRALPLIYDAPIDLRRPSRLVVVGDLRVPRVGARYEMTPALGRVTFDVTPAATQAIIQESGRLLVRFEADALDATLPPLPAQAIATAVRVIDPGNTIEIALGPRYGSYRATTTPADPSVRITIDLMPSETETTPAAPAPPTAPPSPPIDPQPTSAIRTIVIDPGHGGEETGAKGRGGALEKDIALSVARRLKGAIESRLGIRVLLTRDEDRAVGQDERAAIANNNKADLFISLHANASVRTNAKGAEIYYLSLDKSGDEARRQSQSAAQQLPVFGGGSREIEIVLWEMAQARFIDQSAALADIVARELRGKVELSERAIQQAPLRVLVGANMPAVLVEMGYLTNPDQERQLAGGTFQASVVQALFDSIERFREYLSQQAQQPQ